MDNINGDFFETVPWQNCFEQINEIAQETVVSSIDEETVPAATCKDGGESSQPIDFSQNADLSFLDTPYTAEDALAAEKLLDLSEATPRAPLPSAPPVRVQSLVDVAAVVSEAAAAVIERGQTDFDPDEEQRKLLNLLQIPPPQKPPPAEPVVVGQIDFRVVRCSNCLTAFEFDKFQLHVCDYDENQQLITTPMESVDADKDIKVTPIELIFPEEHAAIRLLRENQIRIRRYLKDEMKHDVPAVDSQEYDNIITIAIDESGKKNITNDFDKSIQSITEPTTTSTPNNSSSGKKPENSHECSICDRRFVHASGLLRHMEKHALDLIPSASGRQTTSSQRPYGLRVVVKCQLCGRVFFKVKDAFSHLLAHFPSTSNHNIEMDNYLDVPYEAFVDEAVGFVEKSITSNNFQSHVHPAKSTNYLKVIVLGSVLQCEFCDFIFTDVSYLFLHSSVHSPERRFECLSCGICVNTSKEIFSHFQAECVFMRESMKSIQANTQRYFVCNVCEQKFQTLEHLHEHRYTTFHFFPRLNSQQQKLRAPCEYCELIFDSVQELVFHFEAQHYKKFRRENVLGCGANQASNKLRQYLCDVCGKSYTQSSHLWQHLRFHQEGVKPFACQEPGCSRKFTIRPDLHDHIRKCHTGERPFHCHICGKRFLTGSVFYQHRLIHRGERRYECSYCSKRFYRADALKNHTRIHTGEKPYDCEFCTKSFRQRGDCDKHTRARHAHLDENTRNMLKLQKLNLKLAAAAKLTLMNETQKPEDQQQP